MDEPPTPTGKCASHVHLSPPSIQSRRRICRVQRVPAYCILMDRVRVVEKYDAKASARRINYFLKPGKVITLAKFPTTCDLFFSPYCHPSSHLRRVIRQFRNEILKGETDSKGYFELMASGCALQYNCNRKKRRVLLKRMMFFFERI